MTNFNAQQGCNNSFFYLILAFLLFIKHPFFLISLHFSCPFLQYSSSTWPVAWKEGFGALPVIFLCTKCHHPRF